MATAATLINETLGHLYSGTREQVNLLGAALSDTTGTTVTLADDLRGITAGALVCVDLEEMYVRSVSSTATVIRGFGGSTAATHSNGAQVWVNPKFSRFRVLQALNNELLGLSAAGLYAPKTVDLTYTPASQGYDLTSVTSVEKILEVRAQRSGGQDQWDTLPPSRYQLQRNADTSEFASGFSIQLLDGDPGQTVRVVYAGLFGSFSAESDDPNGATIGFPATANDILPLGAAIRLVFPREVSRNFHEAQGEPRRADEVPPGANANAAVGLARLYERRVKEEANRLLRRYPTRRYA